MLPFLIVIFLLTSASQNAPTSIDLSQPTIITWTPSSSSIASGSSSSTLSLKSQQSSSTQSNIANSTLIVYNMQYQTTANMRKIATFPTGYYEQNGQYYYNDNKATIYEPTNAQYQVMLNYYYQSGNGDNVAAQGVTLGVSAMPANTVGNQDTSHTAASSSTSQSQSSSSSSSSHSLLSAAPQINYKYMQYLHQLRLTQSNSIYIYQFQKSLYSFSNDISRCTQMADFSTVDIQTIADVLNRGDGQCVSFTPQQIVNRGIFGDKAVFTPTNVDDKGASVLVSEEAIMGVTVTIDPIVIGTSTVQVRPLGQTKIDFSQIVLNVKNIVVGAVQNLQITLTNQSPTPIFIKLDLTLADTVLLSRSILIQPMTPRTLSTPISKSLPTSSLAFKLTNPFTNQAYTFNTPLPLMSASNDISYAFNGVSYQQVSGLSIGAIIGMAVGGIVLLAIIGVGVGIVRRKRRQVKKSVQEKVLDLKLNGLSIDRPNLTTSTTQREFLQATIRNPLSSPIKQKPATSTTLDSHANQDRGSVISKQSISLDRDQSQQKVPSIQDKMEYQQKFQEIKPSASARRRFKSSHRRTSSAVQFLPSVSEEQSRLEEIERNRNAQIFRQQTRRMQLELQRIREQQRLRERERQQQQQQQQQQVQHQSDMSNLPPIIMLRRDESMQTRQTEIGLNDGVEQLDHVKV